MKKRTGVCVMREIKAKREKKKKMLIYFFRQFHFFLLETSFAHTHTYTHTLNFRFVNFFLFASQPYSSSALKNERKISFFYDKWFSIDVKLELKKKKEGKPISTEWKRHLWHIDRNVYVINFPFSLEFLFNRMEGARCNGEASHDHETTNSKIKKVTSWVHQQK